MTRLTLKLASVWLYCLTGCGAHAVDLDHAAPASSDPTDSATAVVSNDNFSGVWVDAQRLYWLASAGEFWVLQSCLKADCEHTKLTYMQARSAQQIPATVADGRVYWTSNASFFSCAAEGCQGKPAQVTQDPSARVNPIFAHRDYVYWSSDFDIYRCPAQGCAEIPELVASNTTTARLVFDEKRAYWIDGWTRILSVPSDGSEPPKLETAQVRDGDSIESLAIGAGYLYWAAREHVFRCPIADCDAAAPTQLVTADAPITELVIEGSALYWVEADAIHSCPLSGCEKSLTLTTSNVAQLTWNGSEATIPVAIDASHLYWIEGVDVGYRRQSIRRAAR